LSIVWLTNKLTCRQHWAGCASPAHSFRSPISCHLNLWPI